MILHFDKISNNQIEKFLYENYGLKINSNILLDAFQGSIGKALQLKEKQEDYENIEQIVCSLEKKDKIDIINMSEKLYNAKEEKFDMLDYMNVVFINLAKKSSKYANCVGIVEETKRKLKSNTNYDMCIDNMLLNLWEVVN